MPRPLIKCKSDNATEGYGYQWWVTTAGGHAAYAAEGYGGQLIEVVPDRRLVAVFSTELTETDAAVDEHAYITSFNHRPGGERMGSPTRPAPKTPRPPGDVQPSIGITPPLLPARPGLALPAPRRPAGPRAGWGTTSPPLFARLGLFGWVGGWFLPPCVWGGSRSLCISLFLSFVCRGGWFSSCRGGRRTPTRRCPGWRSGSSRRR